MSDHGRGLLRALIPSQTSAVRSVDVRPWCRPIAILIFSCETATCGPCTHTWLVMYILEFGYTFAPTPFRFTAEKITLIGSGNPALRAGARHGICPEGHRPICFSRTSLRPGLPDHDQACASSIQDRGSGEFQGRLQVHAHLEPCRYAFGPAAAAAEGPEPRVGACPAGVAPGAQACAGLLHGWHHEPEGGRAMRTSAPSSRSTRRPVGICSTSAFCKSWPSCPAFR